MERHPGVRREPALVDRLDSRGHWRYSPRYTVFIVVNSVKQNVFAYRLPGSDLVPLLVKSCRY